VRADPPQRGSGSRLCRKRELRVDQRDPPQHKLTAEEGGPTPADTDPFCGEQDPVLQTLLLGDAQLDQLQTSHPRLDLHLFDGDLASQHIGEDALGPRQQARTDQVALAGGEKPEGQNDDEAAEEQERAPARWCHRRCGVSYRKQRSSAVTGRSGAPQD
jgi:hypothetical protein